MSALRVRGRVKPCLQGIFFPHFGFSLVQKEPQTVKSEDGEPRSRRVVLSNSALFTPKGRGGRGRRADAQDSAGPGGGGTALLSFSAAQSKQVMSAALPPASLEENSCAHTQSEGHTGRSAWVSASRRLPFRKATVWHQVQGIRDSSQGPFWYLCANP